MQTPHNKHYNRFFRTASTQAIRGPLALSLSITLLSHAAFGQQFNQNTTAFAGNGSQQVSNASPTGIQTNTPTGEIPVYFQPGSTREDIDSPTPAKTVAFNRYGAAAVPANNSENPSTPNPDYKPSQKFQQGELVAVVGEEYVLAGDLLVFVEPQLMAAKDKLPESQIEVYREKMMRQVLVQVAQSKMLAQYFLNEQVAGKPLAERQDARRQLDKRIIQAFHESVLPQMMQQQKVDSAKDLDTALREEGTSLDSQYRVFKDTTFAQEAVKKHVPKKVEIDLLSLRDHYEAHKADWERPARARFRQMTVLFSKTPDREEAYRKICAMGNDVLGGASFEAVAKNQSQASRAAEGGLYDWVTQNSLKSEAVDRTVFSIPTNKLSQIIEDSDGLHIVMVIEREAAYVVSFENAQEEIREIMIADKKKKAKDELIEKLKRETSIWTLWPDDIPNSRPLSEICPTSS